MDRLRGVRQCDVFGRGLVHVHPMRMRVINAQEFQPPSPEFFGIIEAFENGRHRGHAKFKLHLRGFVRRFLSLSGGG